MKFHDLPCGIPFVIPTIANGVFVLVKVRIPPAHDKFSPHVLLMDFGTFKHIKYWAGEQWDQREDYTLLDVDWDLHADEALYDDDDADDELQVIAAEASTDDELSAMFDEAEDLARQQIEDGSIEFPPNDADHGRIEVSIR